MFFIENASATRRSTVDQQPWFYGLRGVACLLVLLSHWRGSGFYLAEPIAFGRVGQMGVFLFFFLSAYLISQHIYREPDPWQARVWWSYLVRRAARILPLYYLVLLVDFFVMHHYFTGPAGGAAEVAALTRHFAFMEGRSVFWTLPVEVKFYLALMPLMAALTMAGRSPNRRAWLLAATLATFAWLGNIFAFDRYGWLAHLGIHVYAPFFIAGTVACALGHYLKAEIASIPTWVWNLAGVGALFFVLAQNPLWWQQIFPEDGWRYMPEKIEHFDIAAYALRWRHVVFPLVFGLMFLSLECESSVLRRLLSFPPLAFFGKTSFGIYLLHLPVVGLVKTYVTTHQIAGFLASFVIVVAASWLAYFLIERPCIRLGSRLIFRLEANRQTIPT